jgi:broad specificity phosphatase PhoE
MFLLRHGQSYFNLHFNATRVDPGIEDPELTPLGEEQALAVAARLAAIPLTRIIVSPYCRALQTAVPILKGRPVSAEVMHEVRERAAFVCDVGSTPKLLAQRFPQHDFAHLPMKWWSSSPETAEQTIVRADEFRRTLVPRNDHATTLLVSHWAFLLALTGQSVRNGELIEYDPGEPPQSIDWAS